MASMALIIDDGGERLVDFMRDGRRHLAERRDPGDVGQLRLGMMQRLLGPFALDELTDLAADRRHHVEQVVIGWPDFVAEELHHANDLAAEEDWNGERRVQALAAGERRARKVGVRNDVGDVDGLTTEPGAAGQPDPGRERAQAAGGFESRDLDGIGVPNLHAAEHARLAVEAPQRTDVPAQDFANRSKDLGRRFLQARGLRQDLGDLVLRHETVLGELAVRDVLQGTEHASRLARFVPEHVAQTVDEAYLAARADDAIFDVVPLSTLKGFHHGGGPALPIGGMQHVLNVPKAEAAVLRRQTEDAIRFVRPRVAIREEITLPVPDVRDVLSRFESALALAQVAKHQDARQPVFQPPPNLLEEPLVLPRPCARVRALVQPEHVGFIAFGIDRHGDHGLDVELFRYVGRQRVLRRRTERHRTA